MEKIKLIFKDPDLRKKILFVLAMLALFRVGAAIPIPGVDVLKLHSFLAGNQFFGLLNIFSGGALSNLSIVMLGVGPYITATIIMQLLTMIIPRLKEMYQEEGEIGRKKFNQYSRFLTVPLAMLQGYALLAMLEKQGVLGNLTLFGRLTNMIIVMAGSIVLMWIGELITEYGIGNGVSLLDFCRHRRSHSCRYPANFICIRSVSNPYDFGIHYRGIFDYCRRGDCDRRRTAHTHFLRKTHQGNARLRRRFNLSSFAGESGGRYSYHFRSFNFAFSADAGEFSGRSSMPDLFRVWRP